MVELKGITWDHQRGYDPLIHTTKLFSEKHNVSISWKKRSLKDFGDYPIEKLVKDYDLLLIDHPFIPTAYQDQLFVNLKEYIDTNYLEEIKKQSIGECFSCYTYKDQLLALPVDAAALIATYQPKAFLSLELSVPKTIDELFNLAEALPKDKYMLLPLIHTDIWCLFLTFCAQIGGREFFCLKNGIPKELGETSLELINRIRGIMHSDSINLNPIQVLNIMSKDKDAVYCPYSFGYTNYSLESHTVTRLKVCNSPRYTDSTVSTILGGVGIAVSSYSDHLSEAVAYAKYVAEPTIQETEYFTSGGQPSQKNAWESVKNNKASLDFFKDTQKTIEEAYCRLQVYHWNEFQELSAFTIYDGLKNNIESSLLVEKINELYKKICL